VIRDSRLRVKDKRTLDRLLKGQQNVKADAEIPEIPGAGARLEKAEKELVKLKSEIAMYRTRYDKMLKWCLEQGMRFDDEK